MAQFRITSQFSLDYGVYEAPTKVDAYAAMCADAGYRVRVQDGEIVFASEQDADECGALECWHFEEVEA